ncbi:DNA repair exonuclease [Aerococcaceae bacterium NML191292]|nr:DNA repair exonuclease [Aerococcaceae bacterium NML191292]
MKLMHIADLHLDSPFVGLSKQHPAMQQYLIKAPYQAFERCVSIAINQAVDVFVIVGDVYDSERQTIYAQHFFIEQLRRLQKADIPVVLSHGNHDYLDLERKPVAYPDNVYLFDSGDVVSKDLSLKSGETVRFYGFSYTKRWVNDRKIEQFPNNPSDTTYTIGCLHGAIDAKQTEKGNYAPFSVEELKAKGYDYWALGHIHQAEILSEVPLVQYSGTIQGRHRHELGDKGAFLVEIKPNQPIKNQFISLASIVWQQAEIDCRSEWQASELIQQATQVLHNYQAESEASQQSYLITLVLNNAQRLSFELQEQIDCGELLLALSESVHDTPFVVITKIIQQRHIVGEPFEYDVALKDSFAAASIELEEGDLYQRIMADLFQHSTMKQWLSDFAKDEQLKEQLNISAKQLMIQSIGFETEEVDHED